MAKFAAVNAVENESAGKSGKKAASGGEKNGFLICVRRISEGVCSPNRFFTCTELYF